MKYLVWDLISEFDGYDVTECASWEEAVAVVERLVADLSSGKGRKHDGKRLFKKWRSGKLDRLRVVLNQDVLFDVFVTSAYLTGPLP